MKTTKGFHHFCPGCGHKIATFYTENQALQYALSYNAKFGYKKLDKEFIQPFYCPDCDGWHIGKQATPHVYPRQKPCPNKNTNRAITQPVFHTKREIRSTIKRLEHLVETGHIGLDALHTHVKRLTDLVNKYSSQNDNRDIKFIHDICRRIDGLEYHIDTKPTRNHTYCPLCKRTKMLFQSESKANNFIRYNAEKVFEETGKKPIRAYYCIACGGWHLTSKNHISPIALENERILTEIYEQEREKREKKKQARRESEATVKLNLRIKNLEKRVQRKKISFNDFKIQMDAFVPSLIFFWNMYGEKHKSNVCNIKKRLEVMATTMNLDLYQTYDQLQYIG